MMDGHSEKTGRAGNPGREGLAVPAGEARRAGWARGMMLLLCLAALGISLAAGRETVSLLAAGVCGLGAFWVFYRNLPLLTGISADGRRVKAPRAALLDVASAALAAGMLLFKRSALSAAAADREKVLVAALFTAAVLFVGFAAPRLSFARQAGLPFPWTVRDEGAWYAAHRVLGQISLPIVLLYLSVFWAVSWFEAAAFTAAGLWIGVPGALSYRFHRGRWPRR